MMVRVIGATGYGDFLATVIPGLENLPARDSRGPLTVVVDEDSNPHVVPASTVHELGEEWQ